MRWKSFLFKASFVVLMFFAVIGVFTSHLVVHELSHWQDFKQVTSDSEIYLFRVGGNLTFANFLGGVYYPNLMKGSMEEYRRIDRYTEWKAYSISAGIVIFFLASALAVFTSRWWTGNEPD